MTTIIKGLLLATTIIAAFIIVSCEKNMEEPATADSEVVSSTINSHVVPLDYAKAILQDYLDKSDEHLTRSGMSVRRKISGVHVINPTKRRQGLSKQIQLP